MSLVANACGTDGQAACATGDYRYCPCGTPRDGYAQCLADASGYGACDCSGNIPAGAGLLIAPGDGGDAGGEVTSEPGAFLASCTLDTECATKLCFSFNAFGPHCSQPCANDIDCPAPSPGCSNNKVCKLH